MRKLLKEKLSSILPAEQLSRVYSSFDIIGNIAITKTPCQNDSNAEAIAKQIMVVHKNLKAVFTQDSPVKGEHRTRELKLLAGENCTVTKHKESGCIFEVDVRSCYFSPRLSHERMRIAQLVRNGETVVNMFAGVGCFSVLIAKTVGQVKVYSIDINPEAVQYMQRNIRLNRVCGKVLPLLGDSQETINTQLSGLADRVLMPLPEKALEYLPSAMLALKKSGGWIHFHDFQHATREESPLEKTRQKITQKLSNLSVSYTFGLCRVVRSTGPNWYQTVVDIHIDD